MTHALARAGDLIDDEENEFIEVKEGRVELHLALVEHELHLEDGQVRDVCFVKQINPAFDTARQQAFQLKQIHPAFSTARQQAFQLKQIHSAFDISRKHVF